LNPVRVRDVIGRVAAGETRAVEDIVLKLGGTKMIALYRIDELQSLAQDGAVIVLKIDGERKSHPDIFTVVLSGGQLRRVDFFRKDGNDLSHLIDCAIGFYEEHNAT
jgi:hypothetical protein